MVKINKCKELIEFKHENTANNLSTNYPRPFMWYEKCNIPNSFTSIPRYSSIQNPTYLILTKDYNADPNHIYNKFVSSLKYC